MPITGTDTVLKSLLMSMIQAELAAIGKPPLPSSLPNLEAMCAGIAKGMTQYLLAHLQIAPGQVVTTPVGPGATTTPGTPI